MRSRWIACFAMSCVGWLVCGSASAFVVTGRDWRYQTHPMGEDLAHLPYRHAWGRYFINRAILRWWRTEDGAAAMELRVFYLYLLTIRPINFPFPEFQAARRVKHLTLAVAGYPFVTLTGMSADAGFPRQRHA